ncbi:hypothetical protein D9M71_266620 [compost metagenome]
MLVEDQRRQGAPAQVGGADAFAAVAAGKGDAALAVAEHVWAEASRHAEVAAPGMSDAYLFELREQFAEQVAAQFDFVFVEVEVLAQTPTEAVATASTEDQAVVGGALAIRDLAAAFTEGLALAQANLLPGGLWQRLGGHQQALYWQLVFAQWRQAGGVTLHCRYHPLAANLCQRGTHLARLPVDGRGVFVDRYAQRFHCPGKAAHQLGWLDGRRVRAVDGSKRIADP